MKHDELQSYIYIKWGGAGEINMSKSSKGNLEDNAGLLYMGAGSPPGE